MSQPAAKSLLQLLQHSQHSLIYGFPYNTDDEETELWVAATPPTASPQHARARAFYYDGVDPSRLAIRPGLRKRKSISARRDP